MESIQMVLILSTMAMVAASPLIYRKMKERFFKNLDEGKDITEAYKDAVEQKYDQD